MAAPQLIFRTTNADVCFKQRRVIHFLVVEGERPDCVEERLLRACGEAPVVEITVQQTTQTNIRDRTSRQTAQWSPLHYTVNIRQFDKEISCDLHRTVPDVSFCL